MPTSSPIYRGITSRIRAVDVRFSNGTYQALRGILRLTSDSMVTVLGIAFELLDD